MKRLSILFSLFMGLVLSQSLWAYKESDLQKLFKTNRCEKCDLSGANLTDANLTGADLTWVDLNAANLWDANLTKANLRGANLDGANLTGANLDGATMREAILCNTTMPDGGVIYSGC